MHLLYCLMSGKKCRSRSEATHFAASDLGLHCLLRPVRPNTWNYYSNYKRDSAWSYITTIKDVFLAVVNLFI